jgi:four helix bundle protein
MKYDLAERTLVFAKDIIDLCGSVAHDVATKSIIIQLIRSATSIGANYAEANAASSKKDFRNKIFICKKEARETSYWLNLVVYIFPEHRQKIDELQKECYELTAIFQKITSSLKNEC